MNQTTVAGRIRFLRENAGMKQEEVVKKLNLTRQAYGNYEKGIRRPPIEVLIGLADLYHVPVDYLIRDPDSTMELFIQYTKNKRLQRILKDFISLSPNAQKEVFAFIQFMKYMKNRLL